MEKGIRSERTTLRDGRCKRCGFGEEYSVGKGGYKREKSLPAMQTRGERGGSVLIMGFVVIIKDVEVPGDPQEED